MKHGLAGFQSGCRCATCFEEETRRVEKIAEEQRQYWQPINEAADAAWNNRWRTWKPRHSSARSWTEDEIALARDRSLPARMLTVPLGRTLSAINAMRYRPEVSQDADPSRDHQPTEETSQCSAYPAEEDEESLGVHPPIVGVPVSAQITHVLPTILLRKTD